MTRRERELMLYMGAYLKAIMEQLPPTDPDSPKRKAKFTDLIQSVAKEHACGEHEWQGRRCLKCGAWE